MRTAALGVLFVASLGLPPPARAQEGNGGAAAEARAPTQAAAQGVDVDRLGVNLDRIKRGLAEVPTSRETFDGRRLRAYIQVYGIAPPIEVLQPQDFTPGPIRYGGMTHQEFLDVVTPQEFRAPAASLSNLGIALADWWKKKAEERRREREARERQKQQSEVVVNPPR